MPASSTPRRFLKTPRHSKRRWLTISRLEKSRDRENKVATETIKGLAKAGEIYRDRTRRILELQREGKKIFGYLCIYPDTLERPTLSTSSRSGFSVRYTEPVTKANAFLPMRLSPPPRAATSTGTEGTQFPGRHHHQSHSANVGAGVPAIWNYAIKTPFTFHGCFFSVSAGIAAALDFRESSSCRWYARALSRIVCGVSMW